MADDIDTAANAFLTDMGGSAPKQTKAAPSDEKLTSSDLFGEHDGLEGDDDDFAAGNNNDEEDNGDEGDEELPDDEDAGEEGDEDEDDEGDDEDDEDAGDDEGQQQGSLNLEQKIALTVDGEQVEVPLGEALSGYIRSETFHRRLNILNEAKNEIIREQGETSAARQKYIDGVEALQKQLEEIAPREPTKAEWDAKYANDPAAARQEEEAWRAFRAQKAALAESAERTKAEQDEQHKKHVVNWIRGEQVKMMNAVPAWNDEKTRAKEFESMKRTAKSVGYSDEEVNSLYDSRAVLVLRKAAAYDRLMAKKPKEVKKLTRKPDASGTGRPSGQTVRKDSGRSMDTLRKTGSMDAATAVFGDILRNDNRSKRRKG